VTGKEQTGTAAAPATKLTYTYQAPSGRQFNTASSVTGTQTQDLKLGHTVRLRYLISNPEVHQIRLGADDDPGNADTLIKLGWLMLVIAFAFLFFDLRRNFPLFFSQISTPVCLLFYLGALSVAGGALLCAHMVKAYPDHASTLGTIIKKEMRDDGRGAASTTSPAPGNRQARISYRFRTEGGEQNFSYMVSSGFWESLSKGSRIIVLYKSHDISQHHVRSAGSLDAAEGWYIFGWLFWAMALVLLLLRATRARFVRRNQQAGA
jgi:hypothetical protein